MDHHVAYSLGTAEAQLGHNEQAVGWLRRAAGTGFPCHQWYARDSLLDPLRAHPDFKRFMLELEAASRAALARHSRADRDVTIPVQLRCLSILQHFAGSMTPGVTLLPVPNG